MPRPAISNPPRGAAIVAFIESYFKEHGYPPNVREISAATQIYSISNVNYYLRKLAKSGTILYEPVISRGVSLPWIRDAIKEAYDKRYTDPLETSNDVLTPAGKSERASS